MTVLAEAHLYNQTTYLYGLGDSPLAEDDGAAWTYLSGRDALNSVRQETDAAGQVVAARSFDPYGVVLSGDGGAPFGFTGEYRRLSQAIEGLETTTNIKEALRNELRAIGRDILTNPGLLSQ